MSKNSNSKIHLLHNQIDGKTDDAKIVEAGPPKNGGHDHVGRKRELVALILGKDALIALENTSLGSLRQQEDLCKLPPRVRQFFVDRALAGELVSASAYRNLRGKSRQNPLISSAFRATEEELVEFLQLLNDLDGELGSKIWQRAELNSIQWG